MITLYQLPGAWGLPSVSPYCTKLYVHMELAGVEFEARNGDVRKSPYGKVPWIEHDGKTIADSHVIIEYLRDTLGKTVGPELTAEQRGIGHAAMRVAEEGIYWALVYARWWEDSGWAHLHPMLKGMIPPVLNLFVPGLIRKGVKKQLYQQGTGRLPAERIYALLEADLDALVGILSGKPYLLGDEVTGYDVAVWAPLVSALKVPQKSRPQELIAARPPLVDYVERIQALRPTKA